MRCSSFFLPFKRVQSFKRVQVQVGQSGFAWTMVELRNKHNGRAGFVSPAAIERALQYKGVGGLLQISSSNI